MTDEEIRTGLADILHEVGGTDPAEVEMGKSLVEELDVDSLLMVEVIVAAEERFGVDIADDEVAGLSTVGDIVTYIQGCLASV